jgi:uncharacterized protein YacL
MSRRPSRIPSGVVELLRLCVVIFCATLGYEFGQLAGDDQHVLGPFDALWVGVILGSSLGYVLGGVLGRTTQRWSARTASGLEATSAEEIVAGAIGAVGGVLVAAGITWPVFIVDRASLTFPIFGFVVVTLGMLGYRLGSARRSAFLRLFGARAGMAPETPAVSALPRIVDTSVAIDGRVVDVVRAGFLHGRMLLPAPVIAELQGLADAGDDLRRARGRRGLEVLEALRREPGVEVQAIEDDPVGVAEGRRQARPHLPRPRSGAADARHEPRKGGGAGRRTGHEPAHPRPGAAAAGRRGDEVSVLLLKPARKPVRPWATSTTAPMVVVEHARAAVGSEAHVLVTSVLTTANGRMVFARPVPAAVRATS